MNKIDELSNEQLKKIKLIMDVISRKAKADNIENSVDLLMDHIPPFTYEVIIPYSHFPSSIEPFEINQLIQKIADDFGVINSVKFKLDNSVSLRFSLYDNNDFKNFKKIIDDKYSDIFISETSQQKKKMGNNELKSIHLITQSVAVGDVIFLVLDEHYEIPFRFKTRNKNGDETYIKKLHNISYMANAQNKKVEYDKNVSDSINNGLFRKREVRKYMETNKLKKPTLVQKSENGEILVLKNEVPVKTILINKVPLQHQSLYMDKTR